MKNIATLIRRQLCPSDAHRRYYGNVNMARRKDMRRLKKINIHNKEISGQQNPNAWFTPKRLKALGNMIEESKNRHIGTNALSEQMQKQVISIMVPQSEYQYWAYRNRHQQLVEFKQKINNCDLEEVYKKMPAKLRNAINQCEQNPFPEILMPLLKYTEQLQVYLPQEERNRYNLMLKIEHPPKIKLETDE